MFGGDFGLPLGPRMGGAPRVVHRQSEQGTTPSSRVAVVSSFETNTLSVLCTVIRSVFCVWVGVSSSKSLSTALIVVVVVKEGTEHT